MVKLKGPGLASSAAGGLGKVLIFSESKGRAYCKRWAKPSNPKTPGQLATRAIMAFLNSEWSARSAGEKATWEVPAENQNLPPYNAFLQYNLELWRRGISPTVTYPSYPLGTQPDVNPPGVTAVSRGLRFQMMINTVWNGWSVLVYSVPSLGDPKTWDRLVKSSRITGTGIWEWIWRPIPPGYYALAISYCTTYGLIWPGQFDRGKLLP